MTKNVILRLPPELHSRLVALAKQKRRSLNGQIVYLLERALDQPDSDEPQQLPDD